MDPQIIPPPPPKNEKQQKTVKTQKTVPTIEEASKQQKSKLPNTNLEVSKVGKSPNREKPNAEEKNVDSKKTSPKELTRKGKSNKDEMAAEVSKLVKKEISIHTIRIDLKREENEIPKEQMKPPELPPFHFDRKLVTFIGRIGCEPVTTTLTIFNTTKLPFLFKVKSSNNELFKMIPHLGLVDALSDACIKIIYGGIHVPPPYQEFITVHSMLPDFFNPNIYKTFKEKTNYENRHKFLVDFAYHEDLNELFGDQSEQNFQKNRRYANMWVSPAAIAGKREEMERRLREKLIVGSPKREVKDRRERKIKFFDEHSKNSEWAKSLKKKPIGVKPMKTYKWRGQGTEEKKEDGKKSEEGRTENKRKKEKKKE